MKRIIVQYGGTGDLALKKLYPAYEHLIKKGFEFDILALGRRFDDRKSFVKTIIDKEASPEFLDHLDYLPYDMADPKATANLTEKLKAMVVGKESVELIYYLALQPNLYEEAIHQIQEVDTSMGSICTLT